MAAFTCLIVAFSQPYFSNNSQQQNYNTTIYLDNSFSMQAKGESGELLKTINNLDEGWDGTYQNQLCQNDVYIWKVKYLTDREERKELTGHVTLLR